MAYKDEWITLLTVAQGPGVFTEEDIVAMLAGLGVAWKSPQYPTVFRHAYRAGNMLIEGDRDLGGYYALLEGPWKTPMYTPMDTLEKQLPTTYITAAKWNLRKRNEQPVTDDDLGAVRMALREYKKVLGVQGFNSIVTTAKRYGEPLTGDVGTPNTPALPAQPTREPAAPTPGPVATTTPKGKGPPWGIFAAIIAALLAAKG